MKPHRKPHLHIQVTTPPYSCCFLNLRYSPILIRDLERTGRIPGTYLNYLRLHSELRDHRYGVRRPPVSLSFCTLRSFSSYSPSSAIATELLLGNSKLGSDARCQQRCHIHVFIATATVLPASSGTSTFFTSTTPSSTALSSVLSRARTILQPSLPLATHGT